MTKLQRECLAITPMRESEVEAVYKYPSERSVKEVARLCLSHERLRAELEGLETMCEEHPELANRLLVEALATDKAITDTVWLPGNPGTTVCEELAAVASSLGASDERIESTFQNAQQSDHGLALPIDDDWLGSLLDSYPGRGFLISQNLSIFNSRSGYRLYAGEDGANDGYDTFPILDLKDRGHVLDLLIALGKLKRHNA